MRKINKQAESSRPDPGSEIITMGGKPIKGSSSECSVPVLLPQLIEPKGTIPEVLTPLPITPIEPAVVVPPDPDQHAGVVGDVVHPLTTDVPVESQLSSSVTDIATNPPSLPEIVEATSEAPAQGYGSIVVEGQRKSLRKTTNWKSKMVSRYLSKQREYVQKASTIGSNNRLCAFRLSLKKASVQFPGLAEDAAATEMAQLVDTGAIIPVFAAPKDEKVIHSQLMITPKYDVDGRLDKVKGRLVASGNEVAPSTFTSISETSAPTMKYEGLMTLLSASSFHNSPIGLLDFPGAFLKAFLARIQHVMLGRDAAQALLKVHPEYKRFLRKDGTMVVKVVRALYGLPESGKQWYDCLSSFLVESGYSQSKTDNCIFFKVSGRDKIMFGLHVDDICYTSTSQLLVDEFLASLEGKFGKVKHSTGDTQFFLGLKIVRNSETGEVTVEQPSYVDGLTAEIPDVDLPASPATKDLLRQHELGEAVDQSRFLSRVMSLMYLATKTRPDILFPVSTLASRSGDPKQSDEYQLDRVLKYLRGTKGFKIRLMCKNMTLTASIDASHNIHRDDKGHSGMILFIGDSPIFSRSTKQKLVATSSMHAEVLALFEALPYVIWMRDLLAELGYPQKPTVVEQDNKSALSIYEQGWNKSNKTRHISVKYSFIIEQIQNGIIEPKYVSSNMIQADMLTKPITGNRFRDYYQVALRQKGVCG